MKISLLLILIAFVVTDPDKIGKTNAIKAEAKKAYKSGDYKTAIAKYKYLIDSLGVKEDEVMLNLANAYFNNKDTAKAPGAYQQITESENTKIRSLAHQQLGVLANRQGKSEEALNYFKEALKAAPDNEEARYNYEMLKKKLAEKKKQDQQNQDKKDDKKDQSDKNKQDQKDQQKDNKDKDKENKEKDKKEKENKEQKDKEGKDKKDNEQKNKDQSGKKDKPKEDQKNKNEEDKEKDKKEQEKQQKEKEQDENKKKDDQNMNSSEVQRKLKDMAMSQEKAKMILEAMKNQEVQYLQQNKRKATKPKEKGKPDW